MTATTPGDAMPSTESRTATSASGVPASRITRARAMNSAAATVRTPRGCSTSGGGAAGQRAKLKREGGCGDHEPTLPHGQADGLHHRPEIRERLLVPDDDEFAVRGDGDVGRVGLHHRRERLHAAERPAAVEAVAHEATPARG